MKLTTGEKVEILMAIEAQIETQKDNIAYLKGVEGRDLTDTIDNCKKRLINLNSALQKMKEVKS